MDSGEDTQLSFELEEESVPVPPRLNRRSSHTFRQSFSAGQGSFVPGEFRLPEQDYAFGRSLLALTEEVLGSELRSRCVLWGGFSYDPVAMFAVLVYALTLGERSSRRIEDRCRFDVRFWPLLGEARPDHSTFSRFRRKLDEDGGLDRLMALVVAKAAGNGLVVGKTLVVDGTKVPTAGSQWRKYLERTEAQDAQEEKGEGEGDEPPPGKPKAQRRFEEPSDPEARTMKTTHGEFLIGYNLQLGVDAESGIVLAALATNDAQDAGQLKPVFEAMEKHSGARPRRVVADKAFDSAQNFAAVQSIGAKSYVVPKTRKAPPFHPDKQGVLRCLAGHVPKESRTTKSGNAYTTYKVSRCRQCPLRKPCGKAPEGHQREMNVQGEEHLKLGRANRRRCASPPGKRLLKIRGQTVELANARLKRDFQLRRLILKGLDGARVELLLACIALNLQTIIRRRTELFLKSIYALIAIFSDNEQEYRFQRTKNEFQV